MHEFGPFTFWELFALILVTWTSMGVVGVVIAHRWLTGRVQEDHNEVVVPLYATASVIYAVLLAFSVIAVWQQYVAAKDNVASEASSLTTMYRETVALPRSEGDDLRTFIRAYADAVIGPEWKVQHTGGTSPVARQAVSDMYLTLAKHQATAATSPINASFVANLADLTTERNKRTLSSQDKLPWILWVALIAGGVAVVAMSWFLYMPNTVLHAAMSGIVAAVIGLLVFSTFVLDRPFQGKLGLTPQAFEHAVATFNLVDKTLPR
jgi:hypothetical protein